MEKVDKQAIMAKAREAAAKKRAEEANKEPEIVEEPKLQGEEKIVKELIEVKELKKKQESKKEQVKLPVISTPVIKPTVEQLSGGKWIAKINKKVIVKGNKEKVENYVAQYK